MHYSGEREDTPEERLRFALAIFDEFLKEGDLLGAKKYCQWVLDQNPLHPAFNFNLGNIENLLGNYEDAKKAFILSHQYTQKANPRTLFNIGYICFRLNEFDMATGAYLTALKALDIEDGEREGICIDNLSKEEIYQNLGIAQSCNACNLMGTEPDKAILKYADANVSFNNVMALVDAEAMTAMKSALEMSPELDKQQFLDNHRARSAFYGHAFVNTLLILKDLIKLNAPDLTDLQRQMNEKIKFGLTSSALVGQRREIQHIVWVWQQECGLDIPVEQILSEEVELKSREAGLLKGRLQAMLAWHHEPVDWPALKERHKESIRYFREQYAVPIVGEGTQDDRRNDEAKAQSPVTKKYRSDPEQNTPELIEDREIIEAAEEDPRLARLLAPREKDKVDRLNEEISAQMHGQGSNPHAREIMLSSPDFLKLHGWYRFERGRLAHLIHDSYTYFHQLALDYIRRSLSACHYQLQIAGFKIASNSWVEALAIIEKTMGLISQLYPNDLPCFIGELTHHEEADIQVKRRLDLIQIAKFYIHHALFKGELLRGLVLDLMNQLEQAGECFERCYQHIGVLEGSLKTPQHTETLRLLKDAHQSLNISDLHKIVREYERKIPEKLRARIRCLEELFQQDVLRVNIHNKSIPFPYDMFREEFAGLNQQLGIPDGANVSDHVLSLCYLTPDGTPQVSSIHFNSNGVAFDLYNIASMYRLSFYDAKAAVVQKINYGKQVYQELENSKQQSPSLAFMRFVEPHQYFDDGLDKHSEQAFYVALDRCDPNDLITRWVQASKGTFTPDCTVIACFSNMRSIKTGCPSCKASAIATQNPRHDDNMAFLNRLHTALKALDYKIPEPQPGKPKLSMVTRIRAFTKDSHAIKHGLHQNPSEREVLQQDNLAIVEMLEGSSFVSGFRKQIL